MKIKTIIAATLLTAGLTAGIVSAPANAATWHKGIPPILRHTKWHKGSTRITFGVKWFSFWGPTGGMRFGIPETNVKYKVISRHYYELSHFEPHSGIFTPIYSFAKYKNSQQLIWKWDRSSKAVTNYRYY